MDGPPDTPRPASAPVNTPPPASEPGSLRGSVWPGGLAAAPMEEAGGAEEVSSVRPEAARPDRPFRSVGFTISTTGYAIARRFRELLAPFGLEPREFALLRSVAASEGVSQQAIGERMGVAPSRMVAFVDSLEGRGLLERRQNPDDRRARALFLTATGRALLAQAFEVAVQHERTLTQDLSSDERERLLELLARVGAHLGIPPGVHAGMGHSALPDE